MAGELYPGQGYPGGTEALRIEEELGGWRSSRKRRVVARPPTLYGEGEAVFGAYADGIGSIILGGGLLSIRTASAAGEGTSLLAVYGVGAAALRSMSQGSGALRLGGTGESVSRELRTAEGFGDERGLLLHRQRKMEEKLFWDFPDDEAA